MKKELVSILVFIVCAMFAEATAMAQGIIVHKKNGEEIVFPYSALDSIETYSLNDHECVDLGLSVKWATCNVGADTPEEYGDYYAWGETEKKIDYDLDTYKYFNNSTGWININSNISGTQYDVAHVKWGGKWRMPTIDEIKELVNNCTWKWTTYNGVEGNLVTGPNGNSIFLPAAGYRDGVDFGPGADACFWSATWNENSVDRACYLYFDAGYRDWNEWGKPYHGYSVRPVTE